MLDKIKKIAEKNKPYVQVVLSLYQMEFKDQGNRLDYALAFSNFFEVTSHNEITFHFLNIVSYNLDE